jgi:phosphocarrier protein HPr
MIDGRVTILNRLGLHARATAKLVNVCKTFKANVRLCFNDKCVDAKSIMGVMMLAATHGTELQLSAEGEDETEAFEALKALFEDRFGERD